MNTAALPEKVTALAKARADLATATTAAKLTTARRAKLAAEVRALEAEAEIEQMRLQARADRDRADAAEERAAAAEGALAQERAAHLAEEKAAHEAEIDRLGHAPTQKRTTRRTTATGYIATATPRESAAAPAILTAMAPPGPSGTDPDSANDQPAAAR